MNDIIALVQYLSEPAARESDVAHKAASREREVAGSVQRLSRQAAGPAPARPSRGRFGAWTCRLMHQLSQSHQRLRFRCPTLIS